MLGETPTTPGPYSLRRVPRLLQMSTTADGVGAPWSTSREKTYKKVRGEKRFCESPHGLLRHTSPYECPSAALHVMALARAACQNSVTPFFFCSFLYF